MASSLPFPNRYHVAPKRTQVHEVRQPVCLTPNHKEALEPLDSINPPLDRRESKLGIRNVFARTRTDHRVVYKVQPVDQGDTTAAPSSPRAKHVPILVEPDFAFRSMERPTSFLLNVSRCPPFPSTPVRPNKSPARKSPPCSSKTSLSSSTATAKPKLSRSKTTWDPPPLFQAYAEAIKHATLSAPSLPTDIILRLSSSKRAGTSEPVSSTTDPNDDPEHSSMNTDMSWTRHRRRFSGSLSHADGSQRVYLLTTSGHVLQYARDGAFDRLPEKVLRLGKHSVAFASDAVPGRHWVLQVSQSMHSDGSSSSDGWSLFSRLPFWNSDPYKTTNTILMILDSAEELDSWISLVRQQIETLGGNKRVTETGKPRRAEQTASTAAQPSHGDLAAREQRLFPDEMSSKQNASGPRFDMQAPRPWSPIAQCSLSESRSSTITSVASCDDLQLESLRNSTYRDSYMSSGQRTFLTSQSSSPSSSPVLANHSKNPVMEDKLTHVSDVTGRRSSISMHPQGSSDHAVSTFQPRRQPNVYETTVQNRIEKPRMTTDVTVRRACSRPEEVEQVLPLVRKVDYNEGKTTYAKSAAGQSSPQLEITERPVQFSSFQDQKTRWRNSPNTSKYSPSRALSTRLDMEQCANLNTGSDQRVKPPASIAKRSLPLRSDNSSRDISEQTIRVDPSSPLSRRRRYSAASFVLQQTRPTTSSRPLASRRIHSSGCSAVATVPCVPADDNDSFAISCKASVPGALVSLTENPKVPPRNAQASAAVSRACRPDASSTWDKQSVQYLLHGLPLAPPPNRALPPLPAVRLSQPRRVNAVRQKSVMVAVDRL